ncbi:NAD-dependent epimerase [Reichenbachiella sp. MALMAid0571]|uniref:NAD-dependent epimerase n=1 Tax=Reichenbachiella sp. MALMAid0571 TaxID=3143939 RepID=UPI0032DE3B8C
MSEETGNILVTGAAGFIGFHLSKRLCNDGYTVVGIDNINDYYDVKLKKDRLAILENFENFTFHKIDLNDTNSLDAIFSDIKFDTVINLAAQAGVRYSLENPKAYLDANVNGFVNLIENCRHHNAGHLIFASSSSVYGANTNMPFSAHSNVDHPISLYAATKKANELIAHTYAALFKIPTTGLRFFTAYGPYGRPDMALFLFTKAILEGKPIDVFNNGKMLRDFTYVEDIVEGIVRLIKFPAKPNENWSGENPDPATSFAPYKIYNIGNNNPVELAYFIETIEKCLGKKAIKNYLPIQKGDVPRTYANVDDLMNDVGYKPSTSLEYGISQFVEWYKKYYSV